MKFTQPIALITAISLSCSVCAAQPEAVESDNAAQLDTIDIKAGNTEVSAVPANVPSTVESFTAKQLAESVNSVSSSGALMYLPGVHVRERFIGDVNGGLAMRMYGVNSSAQTTVYGDGLLLSNHLTNSCCPGPRWGLVPQEALDRVDLMYGPFSALYPGNSIGGVVLMSSHMPSKFETSAKIDVFNENFRLYGTDKDFTGVHGVAKVGNRVGDWSFWVSGDRLDNHSHPTDFTSATQYTKSTPSAANVTTVTGAHFDRDIANNQRVITAAVSMDHTIKNDGIIKVAYDLTPTTQVAYTLNIWENTSTKNVDSYIKDSSGNPIYGTASGKYLQIGDKYYTMTAPSISYAESLYHLHGLSVKTNTGGTWDWEAVGSYFNQSKDVTRASSGNTGTTTSSKATAGTITYGDGTGWYTMDLRGEYRPDGNLNSKHQWSFGYHWDNYITESDKYSLVSGSNWQTSDKSTLSTNSRGETSANAIYLQDAWQLTEKMKLTLGGRQEFWQAMNGSNYANNTNVKYKDKSVTEFSPKAALAYQFNDDWALRSSYGRGARFPSVGELFANIGIKTASGGTLTAAQIAALPAPYNTTNTNNPNLKPELTDSWEFALEHYLNNGMARLSLFGEERQDALVSQTDLTSLPGYAISSVQNVDLVRSYGWETALQSNNFLIHGLDLSGSLTYIHSRIQEDRANPELEGTELPLIPKWRASLLGVYHANNDLSLSLGYRFSASQHSALYNTTDHAYPDPHQGVYGGRSKFNVFDAKAQYKINKLWTASVGVDNIGDSKYYTLYPYMQRTYYASMKFDY